MASYMAIYIYWWGRKNGVEEAVRVGYDQFKNTNGLQIVHFIDVCLPFIFLSELMKTNCN